jgi:hypothetical protein
VVIVACQTQGESKRRADFIIIFTDEGTRVFIKKVFRHSKITRKTREGKQISLEKAQI